MPQASYTSQPRLKPCLNCGEQIERDSACCWKCGAKRGALQLPKEDAATGKLENAFRTWQSEGKAKFTVKEIERWGRQAESIAPCDVPAHALDRYWAIDRSLR